MLRALLPRAMIAALFVAGSTVTVFFGSPAEAKTNPSRAQMRPTTRVTTLPPASGGSPLVPTAQRQPAADGTHSDITGTLLPEIAEKMLRTQRVEAPPFPKLTSTQNHEEDTHDCVSCHKIGSDARLPKSHAAAKDGTTAYSVESCALCHLKETNLTNSKSATLSIDLANNGYCVSCHGNPTLQMTFPGDKQETSLFVNREHYDKSVHGNTQLPCVGCHRIRTFPHEKVSFQNSRELARSIERESCIACHIKQSDQLRKSVHGQALSDKNNLDDPGCTDCHGSHAMTKIKDVPFRMGMVDTCTTCHSNALLAAKYKMSAAAARNYEREFHGATIHLARSQGPRVSSDKPVCHDCHGAHDILKANDPASKVSQQNMGQLCKKCHKQAESRFAGAWIGHTEPSLTKAPIVYFVQLSYKFLIPAVMGPFGLYILLDMLRWSINRFKKGRTA